MYGFGKPEYGVRTMINEIKNKKKKKTTEKKKKEEKIKSKN